MFDHDPEDYLSLFDEKRIQIACCFCDDFCNNEKNKNKNKVTKAQYSRELDF